MILHCMRKVDWEAIKDKEFWGEEQLEKEGFIHCSKVEQFDYVAPSFENKDASGHYKRNIELQNK